MAITTDRLSVVNSIPLPRAPIARVSSPVDAISLDFPVETPENVILTYRLAGPGLRIGAYLVDYLARWVIIFVGMIFTVMGAFVLPGFAIGGFWVLYFLLEWGYFILFETLSGGRSLGKWMFGLRVLQQNGQPIAWWNSVLRNLLRVADTLPLAFIYREELGALAWFPIYGPALICMMTSGRLQRLGDLAARTIVVSEILPKLPRDPAILGKIQPLEDGTINRFIPAQATLAAIDDYLNRRSILTYERGHALATVLAEALAKKLAYTGDMNQVRKFPMAFLARVSVTFFQRHEDDNDGDLTTSQKASSHASRKPQKSPSDDLRMSIRERDKLLNLDRPEPPTHAGPAEEAVLINPDDFDSISPMGDIDTRDVPHEAEDAQ